MNLTSKGFKKYDPETDGNSYMKQYIVDDSTHNMDLANKLFVEQEKKIAKVETDYKAADLVIEEKLNNKVTIDGVGKSNFNFMGNGVAPDGLVGLAQKELKTFNISSNYDFDVILRLTGVDSIVGGSYPYLVNSDRKIVLFLYVQNTLSFAYTPKGGSIINVHSNVPVKDGDICVFSRQERSIRVWLNGVLVIKTEVENLQQYDTITTGSYGGGYKLNDWLLLYNRQLEPQEIQHNISTLNNSPSISHLNTTDVDGNVKKFAIATDSHHVEARGGRTQDKINQVFYAQNGKEFVADETGKIEVNNGLEGWVSKAEIQGQTVKNLLYITGKNTNTGRVALYVKQERVLNTFFYNSTSKNVKVSLGSLENSSWVKDINVSADQIIKITDDLKITAVSMFFADGWSSEEVLKFENEFMLLSENIKPNKPIPFGLSSTQAIVSNNGELYPIYEPAIQGKTRNLKAPKGTQNWIEISEDETRDTTKFDYKLDSINGDLGSVPSVSDYIDRAKKVKFLIAKERILDGSEAWSKTPTVSGLFRFYTIVPDVLISQNTPIVSNQYVTATSTSEAITFNKRCVFIHQNVQQISFIEEAKKDLTVEQWRQYLSQQKESGTPVTVRYQLATPQAIQLTDEEFKSYDAYKQIIKLGAI